VWGRDLFERRLVSDIDSRHEAEMVSIRGAARRALSWIAGGVVASILVSVVGQWFIQVATDKGWYEHAGQRWDRALNAAHEIATSAWALYPATLLTGLVGGMWVDVILARREKAQGSEIPSASAEPPSEDPAPSVRMDDAVAVLLKALPKVAADDEAEFMRLLSLAVADIVHLEGLAVWGRQGSHPIERIPPYVWGKSTLNLRRVGSVLASTGSSSGWWTDMMLDEDEAQEHLYDEVAKLADLPPQ
jgi:hypothetical protein